MGSRELSISKDVTANSTEKAGKEGKASPRPWELEPYIYKSQKTLRCRRIVTQGWRVMVST